MANGTLKSLRRTEEDKKKAQDRVQRKKTKNKNNI